MHPIEVAVQRVLTSVLFPALRADDVGVLAPEVHVLDVPLQRHLVKVLVAVGATLPGVPVFLGRGRRCGGRDHGHA